MADIIQQIKNEAAAAEAEAQKAHSKVLLELKESGAEASESVREEARDRKSVV